MHFWSGSNHETAEEGVGRLQFGPEGVMHTRNEGAPLSWAIDTARPNPLGPWTSSSFRARSFTQLAHLEWLLPWLLLQKALTIGGSNGKSSVSQKVNPNIQPKSHKVVIAPCDRFAYGASRSCSRSPYLILAGCTFHICWPVAFASAVPPNKMACCFFPKG